jgi:uncharacterized protein
LADNSAKRILFGADGIRPGWGVLLFVLLLVGFELLAFVLLRHQLPVGHPPAVLPLSLGLVMECAQLFPVALATAIMAWIERRSILSYGYQGKSRTV